MEISRFVFLKQLIDCNIYILIKIERGVWGNYWNINKILWIKWKETNLKLSFMGYKSWFSPLAYEGARKAEDIVNYALD